jgi:hypothetical protein
MSGMGHGRSASRGEFSHLDAEAVKRQRVFPVRRFAIWGLLPCPCDIVLKAVAPGVLGTGASDAPPPTHGGCAVQRCECKAAESGERGCPQERDEWPVRPQGREVSRGAWRRPAGMVSEVHVARVSIGHEAVSSMHRRDCGSTGSASGPAPGCSPTGTARHRCLPPPANRRSQRWCASVGSPKRPPSLPCDTPRRPISWREACRSGSSRNSSATRAPGPPLAPRI